jgi:DNA-binding response OmpR family regulator
MTLLPTTVLNETMHILIIEDDKEIARLTEIYLQSTGYETTIVADGSLAITMIKKLSPDLILLDLMLPGVDGFELCKQAREFYTGPIIVLTAIEDDLSEVSLFKLGADDYLRKPAKPHIMSARIEALLRRTKVNSEKVTQALTNKLVINRDSLTVTLNNVQIDLTNSEFDMLVLLADNAGQAVTREACVQSLRGIDFEVTNRSIDMRISALRRKLNDETSPYKLIKTIRNKGYLLVDE